MTKFFLTRVVFSACCGFLTANSAFGQVRSSADYSFQTDTPYQAGSRKASAVYTMDQGIGGPVGISYSSSPTSTLKQSYIGQLYDLEMLVMSANPTSLVEHTTRQVSALGVFDDGSVGAIPELVNWYIGGFPLDTISDTGLVLADAVTMTEFGHVTAVVNAVSGQIGLMVQNNPTLFSNVTDHVSFSTNGWTFNFLLSSFCQELVITHTNPEPLEMTAPFWYVAESNAMSFIVNQTGIHPSNGMPYIDVTDQVLAQLPDGKMDFGDSITLTGLCIFSTAFTIPDGYWEQFWSDAFVAGAPSGDTDGDGIPDAWENANGLNYLDPSDAAQDPDGDGMNNLAEYLSNSNPNDSGSFLAFTSYAPDASGTNMVLTWMSFSGRTYTIYWTTNYLTHDEDNILTTGIPSTPPMNVFTDKVTWGSGITNIEFKLWSKP